MGDERSRDDYYIPKRIELIGNEHRKVDKVSCGYFMSSVMIE